MNGSDSSAGLEPADTSSARNDSVSSGAIDRTRDYLTAAIEALSYGNTQEIQEARRFIYAAQGTLNSIATGER